MESKTGLDAVFIQIGEFGPYQKKKYILLCLVHLLVALHMLMSALVLGTPKHRCSLYGWSNDTYAVQNEFHRQEIERQIPPSKDENLDYNQCKRFASGNSTTSCNKWVYDGTVYKSTFVNQINLVCGDEFKTSHARLIYFAGILIGSFIMGNLSDTIGRKKTMCLCFWLLFVSALSLAWAPNFLVFCLLRFVIGGSCIGLIQTAYVLGMELVGPSKRVWAGMVIQFFFSFGLVVLSGFFYAFKHWQYIAITSAVPVSLYFSYWWLIPESPRWLISKGRQENARIILEQIAKGNNVQLRDKCLENLQVERPKEERIWNLFEDKRLAVSTIVLFFNWMIVSMGYYGLSLNTGNLSGDFYLNFFLSGLLEIPAYGIIIFLMDRVGRKILHVATLVGGGVACICTIFSSLFGDEDQVTSALAITGKIGISCTFGIIYLWSSEIFPTVVRNAGLGSCSVFARVGSMVSPYIADISKVVGGDIGKVLPMVIFGGLSVLAGLLALLLPETLHQRLPETINDSKALGKKSEKSGNSNPVFMEDDNLTTKTRL